MGSTPLVLLLVVSSKLGPPTSMAANARCRWAQSSSLSVELCVPVPSTWACFSLGDLSPGWVPVSWLVLSQYTRQKSRPLVCAVASHSFLPILTLVVAETRGAMVCVTGIMYAVGYMLAGWMGFACFHMSATDRAVQFSWRFPLAFQVVFPLILLAGSKLVPFSPRWLLSKGRRQEALDVIKRLHNRPNDPEHVVARREFWLMEKQYEMDASLSRGRWELFATPSNRRRTLMAFILMWGDQFLGIFVLTNYVGPSYVLEARLETNAQI
jgi:hypothetical protein